MNIKDGTFRLELKSGEDKTIREITESTKFFYPDEVDVAEELALINLDRGVKSEYKFLVYEIDNEIAGYTCYGHTACTKSSFDLYWIVTDNKYRGKGIGKKLFKETEKLVRDLGGKKIYIETSSRELYFPTTQFYLSCGCKEEAIIKDFYDTGDHKIIFVKDVNI